VSGGGLLTYTLDIDVQNSPAANSNVTDILPSNVTFVKFLTGNPPVAGVTFLSGTTTGLEWNLSTLSPGHYSLGYETQVNSLVTGGSAIVNQAVFNSPGLNQPITAVAKALVSGTYTVSIDIYNGAGEVVKTIPIQQFSQPIQNIAIGSTNIIGSLDNPVTIFYGNTPIGIWDGTNNNQQPVLNGNYYVKVDSVDPTGNLTSVTQTVTVNRTLYTITANIYNESGEIVKHLLAYATSPGQALVTGATLSSPVLKPSLQPSSGQPTQLIVTLNTGITLDWDGTSDKGSVVQGGQYYIEINSTDGKGSSSELTQTIVVMGGGASGIQSMAASPNELTFANGTTSTRFKVKASMTVSVEATIYTVAGERVATVENDPTNPNESQVWDANGHASGLYIAIITARDPATNGIISRQTSKFLIIR
jgi:flagellar hook assembly protein FlgD